MLFVLVDLNGCISVIIQNYAHVHMNFFSHNDRYYHLPESPCMYKNRWWLRIIKSVLMLKRSCPYVSCITISIPLC